MPEQYQYIKLPDGTYGKFAADATDAQIRATVAKNFPTTPAQAQPAPSPNLMKPTGTSPYVEKGFHLQSEQKPVYYRNTLDWFLNQQQAPPSAPANARFPRLGGSAYE